MIDYTPTRVACGKSTLAWRTSDRARDFIKPLNNIIIAGTAQKTIVSVRRINGPSGFGYRMCIINIAPLQSQRQRLHPSANVNYVDVSGHVHSLYNVPIRMQPLVPHTRRTKARVCAPVVLRTV